MYHMFKDLLSTQPSNYMYYMCKDLLSMKPINFMYNMFKDLPSIQPIIYMNHLCKVKSMQRLGTESIRIPIQTSNPKREIRPAVHQTNQFHLSYLYKPAVDQANQQRYRHSQLFKLIVLPQKPLLLGKKSKPFWSTAIF